MFMKSRKLLGQPCVRMSGRHRLRCPSLVHEVNALPFEVIESVQPLLPGAPVEIVGPVGEELLQPFQFGALFPTDAGHLIWPSRIAQPRPQIVEHLVGDVNSKWFHQDSFWSSCQANVKLIPGG